MKRIFDILIATIVIIIGLPAFAIVALLIKIESKGPVLFRQNRVGKEEKIFILYKLRSMHINSDKAGLLTVGEMDPRITKVGRLLRKYKIDELPQFWNVLIGDMSIVGPRPEVKKYTDHYSQNQKKVFQIVPGITDYASLVYFDEDDILAESIDHESLYLTQIMPKKLEYNLWYVKHHNIIVDLKIILKTVLKVLGLKVTNVSVNDLSD